MSTDHVDLCEASRVPQKCCVCQLPDQASCEYVLWMKMHIFIHTWDPNGNTRVLGGIKRDEIHVMIQNAKPRAKDPKAQKPKGPGPEGPWPKDPFLSGFAKKRIQL